LNDCVFLHDKWGSGIPIWSFKHYINPIYNVWKIKLEYEYKVLSKSEI
jgi:hypothetical protein